MATAGILTIRSANTPEQHVQAVYKAEQDINSTKNTNNSASTVKGENGFCILASIYNSASDQYIQNYQAIVFDAVPNIGVKRQADVTSYPVENGANVSDHVQVKNNTFSLSGMITETPIKSDPGLLKSAGVNGNRRSLAIDYLNQIMDSRQPFLLVTENKTFENVVLTGIEYTEEASESLVFDLSFEQIRLVSYGTVNTVALKTQPSKNIGANMKKRVNTEKSSSEGEDTITPAFKQE
ncbi:hypothetical protein VVY16_17585 [Escherichia coli]|uniref:phage baseplate protein n=1 Tax=Escherichia coli TaxID=562 RepID=UPI00098CB841|nr:hypothetical protein [Escherichia coli]EFC9845974.1 hypothetical protein [Escherichia coli]MEC4928075.1 hypothetical protein [Escherichia coli]MEC4933552.1 hypothetical protein [Escherichia coli]MEC4943770.1 hypothetical protein [Escherichia coli]MEC4954308.1 hypothetical protein [Escherichia coli]